VGHCHCATDATQIYAYFGPPITILESYSRTILVRAIVRDAGGMGSSDTPGGKAIAGWRRSQRAVLAKGGQLSG
jgi:hypothetical protein